MRFTHSVNDVVFDQCFLLKTGKPALHSILKRTLITVSEPQRTRSSGLAPPCPLQRKTSSPICPEKWVAVGKLKNKYLRDLKYKVTHRILHPAMPPEKFSVRWQTWHVQYIHTNMPWEERGGKSWGIFGVFSSKRTLEVQVGLLICKLLQLTRPRHELMCVRPQILEPLRKLTREGKEEHNVQGRNYSMETQQSRANPIWRKQLENGPGPKSISGGGCGQRT